MHIGEGSTVTLRCVMRDVQGVLLDGGERALTFTLGRGEVIPGLEQIVRNRCVGYQARHRIAAADAYGEHRPELVFEAVRENLPPDLALEPGLVLEPGGANGRFQLRVLSLTERGVLLDGNHRLAGKDLDVEVSVLAVR
jgi:FKBP-type peptidyl-prolyl cis-trans isomerase 2